MRIFWYFLIVFTACFQIKDEEAEWTTYKPFEDLVREDLVKEIWADLVLDAHDDMQNARAQ